MERFNNILKNTKTKKSTIIVSVLLILLIASIILAIVIPNINFASTENIIVSKNIVDAQSLEEEALVKVDEKEVEANLIEDKSSDDKNKIVQEDNYKSKKEPALIEDSNSQRIVVEKKIDGSDFIEPMDNFTITSRFGTRLNGTHTGIDLATDEGTDIMAAASGTVVYSGYRGSYGEMVIIDHGNGIQTYYAHCLELLVNSGDVVEQGDLIAKVGMTGLSTGPHLHFEVRINQRAVNPQEYLFKSSIAEKKM